MFPVHCNIHKAKIADLLIENAQIKGMYHMSQMSYSFHVGRFQDPLQITKLTGTQASYTVG